MSTTSHTVKGKAYWAALRRMKSESGIEALPGQE